MVNEQQDNWDVYIKQVCWGVRSSFGESTKHTSYEIMHVRKPRFPSELPVEEEDDSSPIALQGSHPNEVADYVSSKQEQLSAMKAKVYLPLTISFIVKPMHDCCGTFLL